METIEEEEEEEEEYLAEAKDHSLVLDVINRDTCHKIVLEIIPHAFFVNLMSMLWRNVQLYYRGPKKRDHQ